MQYKVKSQQLYHVVPQPKEKIKMQYKVKYLCYSDERPDSTFAEYMEKTLNDLGKEGWRPIHITPISNTYGSGFGGSIDISTDPEVIITFAKE